MNRALSCLLVLASTAAFAFPHSIELQLPADRVLPLLHDRARAGIKCSDKFTAGGVDFFVDHIEMPGSPSFRRSPTGRDVVINPSFTLKNAHPLQAVLPIKPFIKTRAAMLDVNVPQNVYAASPDVSLIMNLTVAPDASGVQQLCAAIAGIEPALPMGNAEVTAQLTAQFGTPCFPLPMDGLDDIIDGHVTVTGQGFSANTALDRIALRLEFDRPTTQPMAWVEFVEQGVLSPAPNGTGFSLSIDQGLLARIIRERFAEELQGGDLVIATPPGITSSWPMPFSPILNVVFNGTLPIPGTAGLGLHDITISSMLSLAPGGTAVNLASHLDYSYDADNLILLALQLSLVPEAVIALVDPALHPLIGALASNIPMPTNMLPDECVSVDDEHFNCSYAISLPTLAAGGGSNLTLSMQANLLNVLGGAIVISGTSTVNGPTKAAPAVSIKNIPNFVYAMVGKCYGLHAEYITDFQATGSGAVCDGPMTVKNDPAHVFSVDGMSTTTNAPWMLHPTWKPGVAAYSGYFSTITARTSGGGRTVKLPPVAEVSQFEKDEMQYDIVEANANCLLPKYEFPGRFNIKWHVDPPPDRVLIRSNDPRWTNVVATVMYGAVTASFVNDVSRPKGLASFALEPRDVRVEMAVTIDMGSRGIIRTNVSKLLRQGFNGIQLAETGLTRLKFPAQSTIGFTVPSSALPAGVAGMDFTMNADPTKVTLYGLLAER